MIDNIWVGLLDAYNPNKRALLATIPGSGFVLFVLAINPMMENPYYLFALGVTVFVLASGTAMLLSLK